MIFIYTGQFCYKLNKKKLKNFFNIFILDKMHISLRQKNMNQLLLSGKTVLITGGTRGIGKGIAEMFAQHGANVAFTYVHSESSARELEKKILELGVKVKAYKSDAGDFQQSENLVQQVMEEFGTLNVLVNNAGITRDALLLRMTEEQWEEVMRANLKSVFNLTKAAIRVMLRNKGGSIINISSVVGIRGNAGQANYAASKAGIIGFSKSVALEYGPKNIRCNVVAPGFIETEMTGKLGDDVIGKWRESIPLKRGGTPEDVAYACLFLASDWSNYVTGQCINVCGGMLT